MPQIHPSLHISKNLLAIIDLLNTSTANVPVGKINFHFNQARDCAATVGASNIPAEIAASISDLCGKIDLAFLHLGLATLKTDELTDFIAEADTETVSEGERYQD